jgi:DNA-binding MarR family transcriptional regulator
MKDNKNQLNQFKEQFEVYQKFNERNIVRLLRQVSRYIYLEVGQRLEQNGHVLLSQRHLQIFEYLGLEGANINTLASKAGITKQAMSKLVKEATAAGYTQTKSLKEDSRVTMVLFTEKGIKFLGDLHVEVKKVRLEMDGLISYQEIQHVIDTLLKISTYFDEKHQGTVADTDIDKLS